MKAVNLLPARYRPAVASGGGRGSAYVVLGVLCVLLVSTVAYVLTLNQVTQTRGDLARLQAETTEAAARAAALGDFGRFAQLKAARVASVRRLADARFDWERLTRELARVLPEGVYITELQASAEATVAAAGPAPDPAASGEGPAGPRLTLAGCAPGQRGVASTLVRLGKLHRAKEVVLSESRLGSAGGSADDDGAAGSSTAGGATERCGSRHTWAAVVEFGSAADLALAAAPKPRVPAELGGGS